MPIIQKVGGEEPFEKGLYGCSEFIFDGFIRLMDSGIIKRRVYDHPHPSNACSTKASSERKSPPTT